jgi:hypothetical protein
MPYVRRRRIIVLPRSCLSGLIVVFMLFLSVLPVSGFIDPCPLEKQDVITQYYIDNLQCTEHNGEGNPECVKIQEDAKRYNCQLAAQGYCFSCDPQACSKYGITCKGSSPPPTQTPPPPDGDNTWILVIGAIGAIGVGAVVGAKLLGGKKPAPVTRETTGQKEEKKKEKKKEESVTYILQLSANKLSVTAEQSASLTVTVWKKVGENPPVPEPGAVVTVENPANSGLSVSPSSGNSPLQSEVVLAGETKEPTVTLGITATAGGSIKKAEVTVTIESAMQVGFE